MRGKWGMGEERNEERGEDGMYKNVESGREAEMREEKEEEGSRRGGVL